MRDNPAYIKFGHIFDKDKTGALFIVLDEWIGKDGWRNPTLSIDLQTEAEVDQACDELRQDLELARREAKKAIRRRDAGRAKQSTD
ncbi:MAG: hypothetical protein FJX45_06880 [Alphaproteobacteria bacterium]|nr:hypothetical protein [Alphaproteobacteria bacterium]MBM3651336.1 hypothetical protein [Alphaproteobacteria bacterium]